MQIGNQTVVTIDYTLTDDRGQVLDTSQGQDPLVYIQGTGSMFPDLEEALEGKTVGDTLKLTIPPERAYGPRDEDLVLKVPRTKFPPGVDVEVGMTVRAQGTGGSHDVTVVAIDDKIVTVDANHKLAGMTLSFDVKVLEVRQATADEVKHGHVHGKGGHEH